jgi:hypothetical protein
MLSRLVWCFSCWPVQETVTNPVKVGIKLKPENCDIAFPALYQSGSSSGGWDFKVTGRGV